MTDDPITGESITGESITGESITGDPIPDDYDLVTSRDVTELLHCLGHLHWGIHGNDTTERTAFLHRKAELFTRIANQHARRDPIYSAEVRQLAANARTAAAELQLPTQRVGPDQKRTSDRPPTQSGAKSQENTGASSG
jgi:hypothetical protein